MKNKIPIENIFFMFAYANGILKPQDSNFLGTDQYQGSLDYLFSIYLSKVNSILKKGIFQNYHSESDVLRRPKGKLLISDSIKRNLLYSKKISCEYDEFDSNNIHNAVIRDTLLRILKLSPNKDICNRTRKLLNFFGLITFDCHDIEKILKFQYKAGYRSYKYIHLLSYFILKNSDLDSSSDKYSFHDFEDNAQRMGTIFENFIFNFFKTEASLYFETKRRTMAWEGLSNNRETNKYFPILKTDIEITELSTLNKLIIDAKFYKDMLSASNHGEQSKICSGNLQQIATYLENIRRIEKKTHKGMLLYPVNTESLIIKEKIWDYDLTIRTINLNRKWKEITFELNHLLAQEFPLKIAA